jgi:hypothetical protein
LIKEDEVLRTNKILLYGEQGQKTILTISEHQVYIDFTTELFKVNPNIANVSNAFYQIIVFKKNIIYFQQGLYKAWNNYGNCADNFIYSEAIIYREL